MRRHTLATEQLIVLPKRFETRRFGRGGNTNIALVGQNNESIQLVGFGLLVGQFSAQANIAEIHQH